MTRIILIFAVLIGIIYVCNNVRNQKSFDAGYAQCEADIKEKENSEAAKAKDLRFDQLEALVKKLQEQRTKDSLLLVQQGEQLKAAVPADTTATKPHAPTGH